MQYTSKQKKLLRRRLEDFDFSKRIHSSFKYNNLKTVNDLLYYSPRDFLKLKNIGRSSLSEVQEFLSYNGLFFGLKKSF